MNTKINLAGVELKNPVMTASGTFGSGQIRSRCNKGRCKRALARQSYTTNC